MYLDLSLSCLISLPLYPFPSSPCLFYLIWLCISLARFKAEIPVAYHNNGLFLATHIMGWCKGLLHMSLSHPCWSFTNRSCTIWNMQSLVVAAREESGKMYVLFSQNSLLFIFLLFYWPYLAARPHLMAGESGKEMVRLEPLVSRLPLSQCILTGLWRVVLEWSRL